MLEHSEAPQPEQIVSAGDALNAQKTANLAFVKGIITISGLAASRTAQDLTVAQVVVRLRIKAHLLELTIAPEAPPSKEVLWLGPLASQDEPDVWLPLSAKVDRHVCR